MGMTVQEAKKLAEKARRMTSAAMTSGGLDYEPTTGEIWLEGEISGSYGISASDIRSALKAIGNQRAKLYVNSPGGSVSEGLAIYSALSEHAPGIDTVVTGVAASMASAIFQVGAKRLMSQGALLMIHSPWAQMAGNSEQLKKEAEILKLHEQSLQDIYLKRAKVTPEELTQMLNDETWMDAAKAIALGFADGMTNESAAVRLTVDQAKSLIAKTRGKFYGSLAWAKLKALQARIAADRARRECEMHLSQYGN